MLALAAVLVAAVGARTVAAAVPLGPFPLEPVAQAALAAAQAHRLDRPSGLGRQDYVNFVGDIVGHFEQFQNAQGQIIDPYMHEEIQYATPCYAMGCFTLHAETRGPRPPPPVSSCTAALNSSILELASGVCASNSCNFFTKPVMLALRIAKEGALVPPEQLAYMENNLRLIDPFKAYHGFQQDNWGLVAAGGEFLRDKAGLNTNASWYVKELAMQVAQRQSWTANGQYLDHTGFDGVLSPMPYDLFARSYLAVMTAEGYQGPQAAFLEETGRRGALLSLLMQSPKGEVPTGGRSSQHQWNEGVQSMLFEIEASRRASLPGDGNASLACAFKRGSRLSLQSLLRWVDRSPGGGNVSVVKNWFDPALRWGWEGYSYESQYNLLPAAMVAAGLRYMNDSVPECAAFADAGGFAFRDDSLRKVFLSARGTYAEVELGADPHYDSTGLQRVHVAAPGHYALVGPTAGPAWEDGAVAVGPQWTMRPGCDPLVPQADSLANATFQDVAAVSAIPGLVTNASLASADVRFALTDRSIAVSESITALAAGEAAPAGLGSVPPPPPGYADAGTVVLSVQVSRQRPCGDGAGAPFAAVGAEWPALVFDGRSNFTVGAPANGSVVLSPSGPNAQADAGATQFFVVPVSDNLAWDWNVDTSSPRRSRNGVVIRVTASLKPVTDGPQFVMGVRALVPSTAP